MYASTFEDLLPNDSSNYIESHIWMLIVYYWVYLKSINSRFLRNSACNQCRNNYLWIPCGSFFCLDFRLYVINIQALLMGSNGEKCASLQLLDIINGQMKSQILTVTFKYTLHWPWQVTDMIPRNVEKEHELCYMTVMTHSLKLKAVSWFSGSVN